MYWESDAAFLRQYAEPLTPDEINSSDRRRILDIARDLGKAAPDGEFLEELAGKIERWTEEGVTPTCEYAEKIANNLRSISLALKRDPSQ